MKKAIHSDNAPKAVGPYSQAVKAGDTLYLSGQIALTADGDMNNDSIEAEIHQIMNNLKNVLAAAGLDFSNVVKTEIFLTNMADYPKVNEIYASYLSEPYPARFTVGVASLPKGARVEVSMVAVSF